MTKEIENSILTVKTTINTVNPYLHQFNLSVKEISMTIGFILGVYILKKLFNKVLFKLIYKKVDDLLDDSLQEDTLNNVKRLKKPISLFFDIGMLQILANTFLSFIPFLKHIFSITYLSLSFWTSMVIVDTLFALYLYHKEDTTKRSEIILLTKKFSKFIVSLALILGFLQINGFNVTTLIASLGVIGMAVALAAKDTLANLFSSLSILMDNPFSVKEYIKTKNVEGNVVEIGLRSTTIRSPENTLITVPNSELAASYIQNSTRRSIGRLIKLNFAIPYGCKKEDVKNTITEIKEMLLMNEGIAKNEDKKSTGLISLEDKEGIKDTIFVNLVEPTPSALNILVSVFSKSTVHQEWLDVQEEIIFNIWDIFEKNNIEFTQTPVPQLPIIPLK